MLGAASGLCNWLPPSSFFFTAEGKATCRVAHLFMYHAALSAQGMKPKGPPCSWRLKLLVLGIV